MRAFLRISIVSLAAMIGAVPSSAASLRDYDVKNADSWADALAICDTTRFLQSDPKLESNVIVSAMPANSHVALYGPYFIPPSNFYSEAMRETFDRVQKAGLVTSESYGAARLRYAKLMLSAYAHATAADQAFLNEQMKLCYALAVDTSGSARGRAPKR